MNYPLSKLKPMLTATLVAAALCSPNAASANEVNEMLSELRDATAKYHNFDQALIDGYVDIGLCIPFMGWHFLNFAVLDGTFEHTQPEALVYAPNKQGKMKLVAAEYIVPGDPAVAPEGYPGDDDHWHYINDIGSWTLHAWVWSHNSDGMFADTNPKVDAGCN
ncbi:MAG: hypothetical protein HWE16_11980 [Gammaproteobacteria bacterium]|nr:hypothetical protein [Gammaproteobacteria bacterium]